MKRFMMICCVILIFAMATGCAVPLHRVNGEGPTAAVVINCTPPDAMVFLDGTYIGRAKRFSTMDRPLEISVGVHVVEFELEKYQRELKEVTATRGGEKIDLVMQLRPVPKEDAE